MAAWSMPAGCATLGNVADRQDRVASSGAGEGSALHDGPSSIPRKLTMSQTGTNAEGGLVRPMRAAFQFAQALRDDGLLDRTWRVRCELYRALNTAGRDVDKALVLGLEGEEAACIDSAAIARRLRRINDR